MCNTAWYWGDNEVKETPEEEGKSEYNSRVGTTYSAASRIYTPYSPFKVGEGDDGIPHFPRATPPRSSGTDVDGKPWTASTSEFSGKLIFDIDIIVMIIIIIVIIIIIIIVIITYPTSPCMLMLMLSSVFNSK